MVIIQLTFGIAITCVVLWGSLQVTPDPYIDLRTAHYWFSHIVQFPKAIIPSDILLTFYVEWWAVPIGGFIVFGLFASSKSVVVIYVDAFLSLKRKLFGGTLTENERPKFIDKRYCPFTPPFNFI